jgi:hypothetical protein
VQARHALCAANQHHQTCKHYQKNRFPLPFDHYDPFIQDAYLNGVKAFGNDIAVKKFGESLRRKNRCASAGAAVMVMGVQF